MMKIFIADDAPLVRERLAGMLSNLENVELVGQADNGAEAITGVARYRPDLVILDMRMPGRNGLDVLKTIKQQPEPPIVIMLTAFPTPQYHQQCLKAGAEYFFDKTIEFDRIPELLGQIESTANYFYEPD